MVEKKTPGLSDWAKLIALVILWGSSFMFTRVAVEEITPQWVVTGRLTIAAIILCTLLVASRLALPRDPRIWLFFIAMSILGNALPFFLISTGQQYIDSGLAGIMMAVMPLTTLVMCHFFVEGEQINRNSLIGFILGFLGILVLTGPNALTQLGGDATEVFAQLMVLGGALCYATNTIVARRMPPQSPYVNTAVVMVFASTIMLPFALSTPVAVDGTVFSEVLEDLPTNALIAVAVLGLFSTATATVVYYSLIQSAGPTFLSQINYLIPLWALLMGVLFLNERPEWNAYVALVLILIGIALSQKKSSNDQSGR